MEVAGITDNFYLNGATPVRERQKMVETFRGGISMVSHLPLGRGYDFIDASIY